MTLGWSGLLAASLLAFAVGHAPAAAARPAQPEPAPHAHAWPSTAPFWPHYPSRQLQVLDGQWDFGFVAGGTVDPTTVSLAFARSQLANATTVPGAFDVAAPGIEGPRGTAFYRTHFQGTLQRTQVVQFAACSFYCRVFVDGAELGDHRSGGYQPFWVTAPAATATGPREVLVVVDNQYNATTAPTHTGGDFYEYGGITRQVVVHTLPPTPGPAPAWWLQRLETFTTDVSKGEFDMNVVLAGDTKGVGSVTVVLSVDEGPESKGIWAPVSDGMATVQWRVPTPTAWSPEDPNLHTVTCMLLDKAGNKVDAIQARFGLRVLAVEEGTGRLMVNGKVTKLLGVNRHTMWPDTGSALTLAQVQADVALLKELNANYVRGAHYPQDPRFLDACDEAGIMIWEETLGPGVSLEDLQDSYWLQHQVQAVNEMIDASINHPSVVFHAFYNEGPSNKQAACPGYNTSASAVRARVGTYGQHGRPASRLVTWASDKKTSDVCLDIADVVSFNSYPAWYDHAGDKSQPAKFWQQMVDWVGANQPGKPFTISETGAGGVYEWSNNSSDPRWSQKYQEEIVSADAQFAASNENVTGLTVWQFNDIKANTASTKQCGQCDYAPHPNNLTVPWTCAYIDVSCGRPGGENHKGQVEFWRRKKQSFTALSGIYKAALGRTQRRH